MADNPYDRIFILDTLDEYNPRSATGRLPKPGKIPAHPEGYSPVYREFGYQPIQVPVMPLVSRAA